jgi:hypothetical protein
VFVVREVNIVQPRQGVRVLPRPTRVRRLKTNGEQEKDYNFSEQVHTIKLFSST